MTNTHLLQTLFHDTRLLVFLARTFGPTLLWFALFLGYHFLVAKHRAVKWPLSIGAILSLCPLPLALGLCAVAKANCPVQTGSAVDFLTMTGTLLVGWSCSALVAARLNKAFLRWHVKRLQKDISPDGR